MHFWAASTYVRPGLETCYLFMDHTDGTCLVDYWKDLPGEKRESVASRL
jgi:hypothetical protein